MVRVTIETRTGAATTRASVTAASIERALQIAGGEKTNARVVSPFAVATTAGSPAKAA